MKLPIAVIAFIPPVLGVEGDFNTFRLGLRLAKTLAPKDMVLLADRKTDMAFGTARVKRIVTGELWALCVEHARYNHRELATGLQDDSAGAAERLFAYLQRLFGPHIALHTKKTTVVYLRRIR